MKKTYAKKTNIKVDQEAKAQAKKEARHTEVIIRKAIQV